MQARFDSKNKSRINELRKIVKPYPKLKEVLVTPKGIRHLRLGEDRKIQVEKMVVSKEILERLKAQAQINGLKTEREAEVVVYKDGSQALVGRNN